MNVKSLVLAAATSGMLAVSANAQVVLSENFDTYTVGDLVGQGGWTQLGSSTTNPLQVTAAKNVPMTTGQDAQKAFTSTVAHTNGNSLVTDFDATVNTAAATPGDFFLSSNPSLGSTNYFDRVYARAGTVDGTFQFGMSANTADPNPDGIVWGATDLLLGSTYDVTKAWNFVAGALNDTFSMDVNGAPYLAFAWNSTVAEPTEINVLTLRQGGSSAPGVTVDNFVVTQVIPEPSSLALLGLGGLGLLRRRRGSR